MLNFLKLSGAILILSLFTDNKWILTIALTLFVIAVLLNCVKLWKGKDIFGLVAEISYSKGIEYLKNKKFGKAIMYLLTFPMVIIGIVLVALQLICIWMMLFE